MTAIDVKLDNLMDSLRNIGSAVIAFSGGVDSTMLAAAAYRALGNNALALTVCSATLPQSELLEAKFLARQIGIKHELIDSGELENAEFIANDTQRCYYCKKNRFESIVSWSLQHGYKWVLDGSNADDINDFRPGMRALAEINAIKTPLLTAGFTKSEIRAILHRWNLPVYNKPSSACLATRIAYKLPITLERLLQIERAEEYLKTIFSGQIRLRHHGDLARIEIEPECFAQLIEPNTVKMITTQIKKLDFKFVTLDLCGYKMGSFNNTNEENNDEN